MQAIIYKVFVVIIIFFMTPLAFSRQADRLLPYQVESQKMIWEKNKHQMTYLEDVTIIQGTTQLKADKVNVLISSNDSNHMKKMIAEGKPAQYESALDNKPGKVYAEAERIIYDPIAKKVWLEKNAKVTEENNVIKGPEICYDMDLGVVHSTADKSNKTEIIIQPNQTS